MTLAAALAAVRGAPVAAPACTLWAHPSGSNRADGSARAPLRSITTMMERLRPGQVGCLAPGTTFRQNVVIRRGGVRGRPVQLRGGGRASIGGGIAIRADNVVVAGLAIHGQGENRRGVVVVTGERISLLRNEISGRDIYRSTPCIMLDHAAGTTIDGNVVHECTRTGRAIYGAGIYVTSSLATSILNNAIVRTPGDGIALTGSSRRTLIARNHLHGNVSGVFIGPGTNDALVIDNVIAYSGRHNVHGSGGRGGNLVTANCLWKGLAGNVAGDGFVSVENLVTSPRYVDRFRSLAMRKRACVARGPSSRRASGSIGTPFPVMRAFRIHYRLLGLPTRVRVLRLFARRLVPGASLRAQCIHGCGTNERRLASRTGRAGLTALRGRWLRKGTVIEVRAAKGGWGGGFARIFVTGTPRGFRITHACLGPGGSRPIPCARFARR
jgi:hypothetical protein